MPTLQNITETARIVASDVKDDLAGRLRNPAPTLDPRQAQALADLRRDGFAIVENYWPRERCLDIRDRVEAVIAEDPTSRDLPGGAYLRSWEGNKNDSGVRRIYHIDRMLPELRELRFDPFVLDVAKAYYRVPFHSGLLMFQHNLQSNANTRYFHVDGFLREFKAFVYPEDVDHGKGPFTYIKGSHKAHLLRLRKQIVGNDGDTAPTSFSEDDVSSSLKDEIELTGGAGTLILADVRGLHRGAPQRDASRSVLVNYIVRHAGDLEIDR